MSIFIIYPHTGATKYKAMKIIPLLSSLHIYTSCELSIYRVNTTAAGESQVRQGTGRCLGSGRAG